MDTSVVIFTCLLDIFIVYTIFSMYFYILVKYILHNFEANTCASMFDKHLKFYDTYIEIYKKLNHKNVIQSLQNLINKINNIPDTINYRLTDIIVPISILVLGLITLIYFFIYKEKITKQIELRHVIFTIFINIFFIIGCECLFIIFVYGNSNVLNIGTIINHYYTTYNSEIHC